MNNFKEDLEYSYIDDDILNSVYKKFFITVKEIQTITNLAMQKRGIDKIITLTNGKTITIDEKKRRTKYNDILIEEWSSFEHETHGWIRKIECDYVVYIFMTTKEVYFLPVFLLKRAWLNNRDEWKKVYKRIEAINENYTTISWAIPIDVLIKAMTFATFVKNR